MKWSLSELAVDDGRKMFYEGSVELTIDDFKSIERLSQIKTFHINGVWYYDDVNDHLYTEFNLSGDVVVIGSISLKEYVHHINIDTVEVFGFDEIDDVADYLVVEDEVDLLPVIKQLVVANIPIKVAEDDVEYPKGDGWEIISEADYLAEEKPVNPKLAKLLELDIEDE